MKEMKEMELNMNDLELVTGGLFAPYSYQLKQMDLGDYVRYTGGILDTYYDTNRGNGVWKNVGSEDMLNYVRRYLGPNDPRYIALADFCKNGYAYYEYSSTDANGKLCTVVKKINY